MSGWNDNGVSIMFVKTPKGKQLIGMIDKKHFHIEQADTSFALENNKMYFECRSKEKNYDKFGKDLSENGLHYAVKHFPVRPKVKIYRIIKAVLPKDVIKALKSIRDRIC